MIFVLFPYFLLWWSIPTPYFKFIIFKIILVECKQHMKLQAISYPVLFSRLGENLITAKFYGKHVTQVAKFSWHKEPQVAKIPTLNCESI